ncbi:MORN repeat-containing protein 5-like [Limulus polyphemus]|uniref:MORN repeat-containing protein 5 n=1 Tax=Limulus polyphemus TaxID=6850 RepID=A0ABM1SLH9_LIMPO|nr:MORN repeat-containing protein 5-like [Limulus polyphemus]
MNYMGSKYEGHYKNERMEGKGTYILPTGTRYEGEFKNGMFHGNGKMIFPNGGIFVGEWNSGKTTTGCFTFADGLQYSEENWTYCQYPDRRFWSEICNGLKPAGK